MITLGINFDKNAKKLQKNLHMSKIICNFAVKLKKNDKL